MKINVLAVEHVKMPVIFMPLVVTNRPVNIKQQLILINALAAVYAVTVARRMRCPCRNEADALLLLKLLFETSKFLMKNS